jgi:hypothetical protein
MKDKKVAVVEAARELCRRDQRLDDGGRLCKLV